jgi:hypothetical protein
MPTRFALTGWQKALVKFVRNPTVEVIAAIVVVLLSAWVVIEAETRERSNPFPVLFGHK